MSSYQVDVICREAHNSEPKKFQMHRILVTKQHVKAESLSIVVLYPLVPQKKFST